MGHFHPLLVHMPIGFLLLAILMDLLAYRQSWAHYRAAVPFTLLLGFVAALLSCGSGYLLAQNGSYAYETLNLHQWAAWLTAGVSALLWVVSAVRRRKNPSSSSVGFTLALLLMGALIAFTGHQGGSLTHGGDYLNWAQPQGKKSQAQTARQDTSALPLAKINPDLPKKVDLKAIERLQQLGFNVRYMLKQPVMLDLTLPAQSGVAKVSLDSALRAVAPAVVWLNLANNDLQAADLLVLKACKNLEKLRLEKNPLGDGIVDLVHNLKHLEAINLNETQVSAAAVERLKSNGKIRIYAWSTAQ